MSDAHPVSATIIPFPRTAPPPAPVEPDPRQRLQVALASLEAALDVALPLLGIRADVRAEALKPEELAAVFAALKNH